MRSVAPAERKGTGKTEAQTGEERGAEPQGAAQVSVPDRRSHHRPREPGGSRGAYGEGRHRELQSQNSWGRTPAASPPGCMTLGNDAASPRSRLARETRTTPSQRAVVRVKRDGERREPSLAAPLHPQSVPAPGVKLGTPRLHTKQRETVFLCSGIRIFFKKQIYELRLGKTNVYSLGPLFTNNFPYVLFFCFPDFFKVRCLCDYQAAPKGLGFNGKFLLAFAVKAKISCNNVHLPLTTRLTPFTSFMLCWCV